MTLKALSGFGGGNPWAPSGQDVQTFSASGTWIKPVAPPTASVKIECIGGGGGGGCSSNSGGGGGGGGGGAYATSTVELSTLNSQETATVGAGGAGGLVIGAVGVTGGDSTFAGVTGLGGGGGGKGGSAGLSGGTGGGGGDGAGAGGTGSVGGDGGTGSGGDGQSNSLGGGGGAGNRSGKAGDGGNSTFGGGGGGGGYGEGAGSIGLGGISVYAGDGGRGQSGDGGAPVSGTAPGGGGGGDEVGGVGNGADGQVKVTTTWVAPGTVATPPVTVLAYDTFNGTTSSSTQTSTAMDIGTATADRIVVVGIATEFAATTNPITSCTIAGVSANYIEVTQSTGTHNRGVLAWAAVPTGTTAVVTVVYNQNASGSNMHSVALTGIVNPAPITTDTSVAASASVISATGMNETTDGFAVALAHSGGPNDGWTWTGLSEINELNGGGTGYDSTFATKQTTGDASNITYTATHATSESRIHILAATWR